MATSTIYFRALWFDGQSAARHAVRVSPARDHLVLEKEDGTQAQWKYTTTRLVPHTGNGPVRLEHTQDGTTPARVETLVVEDSRFLPRVYVLDPGAFRTGLDRLLHPTMKRLLIVTAIISCPLILVLIWQGVVPLVSNVVSANIPVSWEEKLGESAVESLLGSQAQEPPKKVKEAIDRITQRLLATLPDQPYHFKVYVHPGPLVNAMAFPGGIVVVFQGLINATKSPEELAGVLAHEFQHVLKRHATRRIIRDSTLTIVISLIAGNTDLLMMVLESASLLEGLRYSRDLETEADREGMTMIQAARVDPQGMVRAFETLHEEEKKLLRVFSSPLEPENGKKRVPGQDAETGEEPEEGQTPAWMKWLSTHPAGEERLQMLRQMAGQSDYAVEPLLPDADWSLMHRTISKEPKRVR